MNTIRREQILDYLKTNKLATMDQLSQLLPGVSLMTIHRDLNYLRDLGLLDKVRGGARYIMPGSFEPAFFAREVVHKAAKQVLAEKAAPLTGTSNSFFLDAGTTMLAFARLFPDTAANVMTTGPNIAIQLSTKKNLTIGLCGGVLNKSNLTLSGSGALEAVSKVNIDTAFLVASGFSRAGGFTCGKEDEARIKTQVISQARKAVMLMDTSKIERMLPYTFAQLEDFDCIVTEKDEKDLPVDFVRAARKAGVQII